MQVFIPCCMKTFSITGKIFNLRGEEMTRVFLEAYLENPDFRAQFGGGHRIARLVVF